MREQVAGHGVHHGPRVQGEQVDDGDYAEQHASGGGESARRAQKHVWLRCEVGLRQHGWNPPEGMKIPTFEQWGCRRNLSDAGHSEQMGLLCSSPPRAEDRVEHRK
ncbi:hypothetical protein GCM10010289_29550 [Streptomyces violascens]|uniref:Uncharacterized protein n=1 Tax=Streptomyces violascens TaxID=67381 RepID=A0ABQ3QUC5_9ACTN|nr:hypothetical protein GCM10010289_29550 [Streptomyces violascens]GHI40843.1 hypothetical protein Sviol_52510 [Streptomyces violascens]